MNIIKQGFIRFWSSPKCVFWFGMLIVLIATSLEVFRGRNTNYFDYQDSTRMFWDGITPYTMEYANAHCIYFLYSSVFSVLFAPIYFLPWWLGPYVWNIGNYSLYSLAIKTLPKKFDQYKHWIFLFMLPVLLQAIFCYQHNTIVAYIFIFAYSLLERGKGFWAVLIIMMSACTKVYGGVELALLLCYPKMWRNFGYAILCGAGLLSLPLLNPNFDNPLVLYQQMFDMIASHHSDSDFIGILFARGLKPFLLENYREVQMAVLGMLAVIFFASYKRWHDSFFRTCVLAVLSGFIILFSDCPETHTYLIALGPYAMAFWMQSERKWYDWALFASLVFNFGIIPTDVLCPAWLHEWIHCTFWSDVYTFFFCWLRILWLAVRPESAKETSAGKIITGVIAVALAVCLIINWEKNNPPTPKKVMAPYDQIHTLADRPSVPGQKTFNVKGVIFRMNLVEGGTFLMGNQEAQDVTRNDEKPQKRVTLKNYYIGETEVTQELWEALMPKNRSKQKGKDMPVEYVTQDMVAEFIDKLNAETHMNFRLPTEAEWEYAARGGKKSKGYIFSGSNNIEEVAFYNENSRERHYPVAQKKPNELGLYDMTGNVWEMCSDYYGPYDSDRRSTSFHVIRGGAYNSYASFCTNTNRYMYDHRRRRDLLGFRLVAKI